MGEKGSEWMIGTSRIQLAFVIAGATLFFLEIAEGIHAVLKDPKAGNTSMGIFHHGLLHMSGND